MHAELLVVIYFLFISHGDGFITTVVPAVPVCDCNTVSLGYQDGWYDHIIEENGDHYLVPRKEMARRDPRYNHGRKSFTKMDVSRV